MNIITRTLAGIVALAAGCATLTACEPVPGTVDIVGDSLTIQGILSNPDVEPDTDVYAGLGWRVDGGYEAPSPQEHLDANVVRQDCTAGDSDCDPNLSYPRPEVVVVALGTNDARPANGGWDLADVGRFDELVNRTVHDDACVAIVLPAYGDGIAASYAAEVDHARRDLVTVAGWRDGPTVVADWAEDIAAHPEWIEPDGIHLTGPDAYAGRWAVYDEAIADCRGLLQ